MKTFSVLGLVSVGLLLAVLGFGLTVDPNEIDSPLVGRPAPEFELGTFSGDESVGLSDLRGQVIVLNFWASWCLPCIEEHDVLLDAWRTYAEQGVEVVGVLYQDSPDRADVFLDEHGGGWLQLHDADSRAAIEYGVYGVPETFVIGADGVIAFKKVGPIEAPELTAVLEEALTARNGSEP